MFIFTLILNDKFIFHTLMISEILWETNQDRYIVTETQSDFKFKKSVYLNKNMERRVMKLLN